MKSKRMTGTKKPLFSDTLNKGFLVNMAVREGFEPSIRCRIHAFQASSFSHSDTSPYFFVFFDNRCHFHQLIACGFMSSGRCSWLRKTSGNLATSRGLFKAFR